MALHGWFPSGGISSHRRGHHRPPSPGVVEAVGVAPEGAQLIASSLSTEVVETILQSRAPSMRKLYALKWKLFTSWCGDRQLDPVNCPVGSVLEFLQARLSAGSTHSTLKVYVVAITAYHAPLGGQSVGRNPLVTSFLRGALRLRPPVRSHVPHVLLSFLVPTSPRPWHLAHPLNWLHMWFKAWSRWRHSHRIFRTYVTLVPWWRERRRYVMMT